MNTKPPSFYRDACQRLKKQPGFLWGLGILSAIMLGAILIPYFCSTPYDAIALAQRNHSPCAQHWFGTDDLGRDLFVRLWVGARITLMISSFCAIIDMLLGTTYGIIAGYARPGTQEIFMRFLDILTCIPYLLFVILFNVIFIKSLWTVILSISLLKWANMARIVRNQIRQLKTQEFILSAHALGASPLRILRCHILPHILGTIITITILTIPSAIYTEAFISFLGLGVQPPLASWGTLLHEGIGAVGFYPYKLVFISLFLTLTLLSLHLIGQAFRNAFDPGGVTC